MRRVHQYICISVFLLSSQLGMAQGLIVEFEESTEDQFNDELRAIIMEIAQATKAEVAQFLPDLPEDIRLTVSSSPNVIPQVGVGAASVSPGHIQFVVDTSRTEGAESIIRTHLRSTLFHEMHHQARGWVISGGDSVTSFMDAVVGEGMATVFEREFAGSSPLWGNYPEDVQAWVDELIQLPLSAYAAYNQWMFFHPDGRQWIGYRAGTYIVDQAQANSGLSSAEMVRMPTQEILDLLDD